MSRRPKILIIDDELRNINVLLEILVGEYEISFTLNGKDGILEIERFKPDIILLDIMMPDENGFEICCQIRAQYGHSVKIILVSAKHLVEDRIAGYEAGADDYIVRPFSNEELLAKLRVYLRLKDSEEWAANLQHVLELCCDIISTPSEGVLSQTKLLLSNKSLNRPAQVLVKDIALKIAAMADRIGELADMQPVDKSEGELCIVESTPELLHVEEETVEQPVVGETPDKPKVSSITSFDDAKVLLVDDSTVMRIIQRKILQKIGFSKIDEAENGREAIRILEKNDFSYSLMFCDMNMPILHGLEVLETVRKTTGPESLPVIMCSSVAYTEDVERAMSLGASGYITKPFRPADIVAKLSEIGLCTVSNTDSSSTSV